MVCPQDRNQFVPDFARIELGKHDLHEEPKAGMAFPGPSSARLRTIAPVHGSSVAVGLAALSLAALVTGGCGAESGAPGASSRAVATVAGYPILRAEVDHWIAVFAAAQPRSGGPPAVPDPPRFARCAAALARQPLPRGATKRPTTQRSMRVLRARCRRGHEQLKRRAMTFLIELEWVERVAAERGIRVDERDLGERFDRELADAFPSQGDLDRYLAGSGQTRDDALDRLRLVELQARLMRDVKASLDVTDADISRYYRAHRELFHTPLAQARDQVARAVRARREQDALQTFTTDIRGRMRPRTWCASKYLISHCRDAPDPARLPGAIQ